MTMMMMMMVTSFGQSHRWGDIVNIEATIRAPTNTEITVPNDSCSYLINYDNVFLLKIKDR